MTAGMLILHNVAGGSWTAKEALALWMPTDLSADRTRMTNSSALTRVTRTQRWVRVISTFSHRMSVGSGARTTMRRWVPW